MSVDHEVGSKPVPLRILIPLMLTTMWPILLFCLFLREENRGTEFLSLASCHTDHKEPSQDSNPGRLCQQDLAAKEQQSFVSDSFGGKQQKP